MKVKPKQFALVLYELTKDAQPEEIEKIATNFIDLLFKYNQVSKLDIILDNFNQLWNKEKQIVEAEVISAYKLDQEIVDLLKKYIVRKVSEHEIIINKKTNRKTMGGFIIRYNDKLIDSSIANRLRELRNSLTN